MTRKPMFTTSEIKLFGRELDELNFGTKGLAPAASLVSPLPSNPTKTT